MKLNIIFLSNWIFSLFLLFLADAETKLQQASDFQNLYAIMVGNIDILNIGFYPTNSLLVLAPFAFLINDIGNFALFFLILVVTLYYLNLRFFLSKSHTITVSGFSYYLSIISCFFVVHILTFSSINFFW